MTTTGVKEGELERLTKLLEKMEKREEETRHERDRQKQETDHLKQLVRDLETRLSAATARAGAVDPAQVPPEPSFATSSTAAAPRPPCKARMPTYRSGEDIETFFKRLETYFSLIPRCDDDYKISMLQLAMDESVYDIAANIVIPEEYAADYAFYKKAYVERFEPRTSVRERRRNFRLLSQEKLNIDEFYDKVRKAASQTFKGEDAEEVDRLIAEQMVYGLTDPYMKRRLLESEMDTSKEVIKSVKLMTSAQNLTKDTTGLARATTTPEEDRVTATTNFESGRDRDRRGPARWGRGSDSHRPSRTPDGKPICFRCGKANHIAAHCHTQRQDYPDSTRYHSQEYRTHQSRGRRSSPPPYSSHYRGPSSRSPSAQRGDGADQGRSFHRSSHSSPVSHQREYSPLSSRQSRTDAYRLTSYRSDEDAHSRQHYGEEGGASSSHHHDPTVRTHSKRSATSPKGLIGTIIYEQSDTSDELAAVAEYESVANTLHRITKAERGGSSASRHHAYLEGATSEQEGAAGARRHDTTSRHPVNPRHLGEPKQRHYAEDDQAPCEPATDEVIGAVCDDVMTENEHVMYVRGYVNGVLLYSLIDTGSVVSIMHKDVFEELCAKQNIALSPPPGGNLRGIDSGKVKILGLAENVPVQLCNVNGKGERVTFSDTFLVCGGIAVDCLIGTKFQRRYRAQIDADKCTLTLNNGVTTSKHALVKNNHNTEPVTVYVQEEHIVPARSQSFLRCRLDGEQCDVKEDWRLVHQALFTPTTQMHERYGLLLANCVTSLSDDGLVVHVINPIGEDFTLRSGVKNQCAATQERETPPVIKKALATRPSHKAQTINLLQWLSIIFSLFLTQARAMTPLSETLGPAKLCFSNKHGQLFDLGAPPVCNVDSHQRDVKEITVIAVPYFRKFLSESFAVAACTIEIEQTWTYMNFVGGRSISRHEISYRAPDAPTCKHYADHLGKLKQVAPFTYVNTTSSTLKYTWCCRDVHNVKLKLILKKLFVSFNYQNSKLFSASIFLHDCDPNKLSCLVDRQMIIWEANTYDNCSLIQGKAVRAQQRGNEVVSTEGQFAVTLTGEAELICNNYLQQTLEGVSIHIITHSQQPFHNLSSTLQQAYKTSNLFLTVSYVSMHLQDIIHTRFLENFLAICTLQRSNWYQLRQVTATSHTTIAMRGILQSEHIVGENRGDLIQISQCLNVSHYFLRTEEECYNHIPIVFDINNHTVENAFLVNSHLREITHNAPPVPCDKVVPSFYKNNGSYLRWTGKMFQGVEQLSVTHLQTALAFKDSENFHISQEKLYDEDTSVIHQLMHLKEMSSKTRALTELLAIAASDTDVSLEEVKDIANKLHSSTNDVLRATTRTFRKFIPSYTTLIVVVSITLILIIVFMILLAYLKHRRSQITLTLPSQNIETAAAEDSTVTNPATVMRFRELLEKYDNEQIETTVAE